MPFVLDDRRAQRCASALRQGALNNLRVADAMDPKGRTHFLIEVSDMGQFAKDWETLKTIIKQKDDAIDAQAKQLSDAQASAAAKDATIESLKAQITDLQNKLPDADDQTAVAEVHEVVQDNAPATANAPGAPNAANAQGQPAAQAQAAAANAAATTTFTK